MSGPIRRRAGPVGRCVRASVATLALAALGWSGFSTAAPSFAAVASARAPADSFNYDRFGTVTVYRGRGRPRDVVLFVSGDQGWDAVADSMAQELAAKGALVAGIDMRHYRGQLAAAAESCVSPAPDFENLSHYLQSKLGLKKYLEPTLVGYASGATLAYATLAEAPEGLFKGALSVGFCPELDLQKAICKSPDLDIVPRVDSHGVLQGMSFSPAKQLPGQWIVLQAPQDAVCPAPAVQKFVAAVPGAAMVNLPEATHDATDPRWRQQFEAAYGQLAAIRPEETKSALPAAVADLPLVIVPAGTLTGATTAVAGTAAGGATTAVAGTVAGGATMAGTGAGAMAAVAGAARREDWFAIFLSGDGGWVGLDKGVAAELAKHDIPTVGWDSLKYFWSRRTPEGASRDLDRVMRYYSRAWNRPHVLLIGYSQGADTMPFMVNRLPAATHELVGYTTLLGISDNALWEFHVATWLGHPAKGIPTAPELAAWSGSPYLCLYGESDGDAACAQLTGHDGTALKLSGGHHFGGEYAEVADDILSRLPTR